MCLRALITENLPHFILPSLQKTLTLYLSYSNAYRP